MLFLLFILFWEGGTKAIVRLCTYASNTARTLQILHVQFNSQSLYVFEMESTGDIADPELFLWQELTQSLMLNAVSS